MQRTDGQRADRISNKAIRTDSRLTAVLGPTNTGKTHFAIEQMVSYDSGVIGFPLRLLARENYERLVRMKGVHAVALVTGEEKIIPPQARYYSCTVESMPVTQAFEFLAVDEIQHCADPDRGHIFTDRLLRARGLQQTMFMGAETIRPLIASLVPDVEFISRPRLSRLSYTGYRKLTRLPPRSAVVAFSIEDVYAIAELVRSQKGGTAVVLGALSPRTRNKQVEMYQNGEVDYLVATDAIGMGLNMDIDHVALAATRKFDGQFIRTLDNAEIAQIAGRAGRHTRDGTFGITGRVRELDEETVRAIEHHDFPALKFLYWRNSILDFQTPAALLASLERHSGSALLARGRPADDYSALVHLTRRDTIMARAASPVATQILWDVCQIPDFRQTLSETHQDLLAGVYESLIDYGLLEEKYVARQLDLLDRLDGDVDTLMARIAHIRTWTYITHKSEWLKNAAAWADRARGIEDRLSDALHEGLIKRFVDRRSAVLLRAIEEGTELLAGVRANGEVVVEGQEVGVLDGFRFIPDETASGKDYKAVMAAARSALRPEIRKRVTMLANAEDKQFRLNDQGQVLFQTDPTNPLPGQPVATLRKGSGLLQPDIDVLDSNLLEGQDKTAIAERLATWLKAHIASVLESLMALNDEQGLQGAARGIAYQIYEAMGILPRADLEEMIAGLDDAGRAALRAKKVRLGPVLVFLPALNKPAAIRLRALLWSLWHGAPVPAPVPADGVTSISVVDVDSVNPVFYRAISYPVYGPRAIRVDMLDRVISAVYDSAKEGKFQATHAMAEWMGCSIPDLYAVLEAMGHKKIEEQVEEKAEPEQSVESAVEEKLAEPVEAAAAAAEKPQTKPELATFLLRRGKAYGKAKPAFEKKKPRPEKAAKPRRDKKEKSERKPERERVVSAKAKTAVENNPFAVLQNMKIGREGGE